MEKLKSEIPAKLKRTIAESTVDDIPYVCSSLHDFFRQSPLFHQMIDDLTNPHIALCRKNKESAQELKLRGNGCFSTGDYPGALTVYSKALRVAPMDAIEKQTSLVATLYVNRASTLYKMGLMTECLRDCNRALSICPMYVKAWYRRGKANVSLQNYTDAEHDLKVALEMEHTCSAKKQLKKEVELIIEQSKVANHSRLEQDEENFPINDELVQSKLECVLTQSKGRGMVSSCNIPEASLVHREEPYALIILKNCRETHCHFCLNELPVDTVPCYACSIPLYCSQKCQKLAGQQHSNEHMMDHESLAVPRDLGKHFSMITFSDDHGCTVQSFAEHRHECHGFHWPLVLPSDVVLAGRILVKSMEHKGHSSDSVQDLSHNYDELPAQTKLESIVYSIVLLYCLQQTYDSTLGLNATDISKVLLIICQIRVNTMAVVRIKSQDISSLLDQKDNSFSADGIKSNIEQVRVGQAIYSAGSFFNHSCEPNIHAYFLSRTLLIRSTKYVEKGCPLELSYGPQVGQLDCGQRQQFLEEKYSFRCECIGCTQLNLPDLVVNSFHCTKPDCLGVVPDSFGIEYQSYKINHPHSNLGNCSLNSQLPVDKLNNAEMRKVAGQVFEGNNGPFKIEPGCCLTCGSSQNLCFLNAIVQEAEACIKSLRKEGRSKEVLQSTILEALRSLTILKSACQSYNRKVAEAEDIIAEAFCLAGDLELAATHCIESIKILKKLYGSKHIAIGNELVKLASLQCFLHDSSVMDTVNELNSIFLKYYGPHAVVIFPYMKCLKENAAKMATEEPLSCQYSKAAHFFG